ncbi:MAG TPA: hypothetical protein VLH77_06840 [Gammaproteobacteria bacterium]|nr:hypothetical protein [Gammaproteobacteria bacterium]
MQARSAQEEKQVEEKEKGQQVERMFGPLKNSQHQPLKQLFLHGKKLNSVLKQRALFENKLKLNKWQEIFKKLLTKKRDEILVDLRKDLKPLLEPAIYTPGVNVFAYRTLFLLTRWWPNNDPFIPSEEERRINQEKAEELAGCPLCPCCGEVIWTDQDRIVTSFPTQFHLSCLAEAWLRRPTINPMTNLAFSSRDVQLIRTLIRTKLRPLLRVNFPDPPIENREYVPTRILCFVMTCFPLLVASSFLATVSVVVFQMVSAFCLLGMLGGIAYMLYQCRQSETALQMQRVIEAEIALQDRIREAQRVPGLDIPNQLSTRIRLLRESHRAFSPIPQNEEGPAPPALSQESQLRPRMQSARSQPELTREPRAASTQSLPECLSLFRRPFPQPTARQLLNELLEEKRRLPSPFSRGRD